MSDKIRQEYDELCAKLLAGLATDQEAIRISYLEEILKRTPTSVKSFSIVQKITVVAQEMRDNYPFTKHMPEKSAEEWVDELQVKFLRDEINLEVIDSIFSAACRGWATYIDIGEHGTMLFLTHPTMTQDDLTRTVANMDLKNTEWKPKI